MKMSTIIRFVVWIFVFSRVISYQNVINEKEINITVIEFFQSEYFKTSQKSSLKQVGLTERVYFEIVDHFNTPKTIVNWPLNCWITLKEMNNAENATKFIKDGCGSPDAIIYSTFQGAYRVGFTLMSAGRKEVKDVSFDFFIVQCEYIKCSQHDSNVQDQDIYPQCLSLGLIFGKCRDSFRQTSDDKHVQIARSETQLNLVPKPPEEVRIPSPDVKVQPVNDIKIDDAVCDCSNQIKNCMSTQQRQALNDGRMSLPVVAAVAFASFSIGVLLMAGLCWVGGGQRGKVKNDQSKVRYPTVKFIPSSASNESILNWSSNRSIPTYTSVVADINQRS